MGTDSFNSSFAAGTWRLSNYHCHVRINKHIIGSELHILIERYIINYFIILTIYKFGVFSLRAWETVIIIVPLVFDGQTWREKWMILPLTSQSWNFFFFFIVRLSMVFSWETTDMVKGTKQAWSIWKWWTRAQPFWVSWTMPSGTPMSGESNSMLDKWLSLNTVRLVAAEKDPKTLRFFNEFYRLFLLELFSRILSCGTTSFVNSIQSYEFPETFKKHFNGCAFLWNYFIF